MSWSKSVFITSISLLLFAGCSSTQTQPISTEVVPITQAGDTTLSCEQLAEKINQIEQSVSQMVKAKQQRENKTFTLATIMDMTLNLLSMGRAGAAGHIDRATLTGFSKEEQLRLLSLTQRHDYLLKIAKTKSCHFSPEIEKLLGKVTESSTTTPNFRQRIQ